MATITETDPAKLVRELHATALALAQAKQRAQADPTGPNIAAVRSLLDHFRAVADQYRRTGAAGDMSAIDRQILETGNYVAQVLRALPEAIAYVPKQITAGLLSGLWPWLLGAGALWWFTAGGGLRAGSGRQLW